MRHVAMLIIFSRQVLIPTKVFQHEIFYYEYLVTRKFLDLRYHVFNTFAPITMHLSK
jgi:hypothetical protein